MFRIGFDRQLDYGESSHGCSPLPAQTPYPDESTHLAMTVFFWVLTTGHLRIPVFFNSSLRIVCQLSQEVLYR